MHGSITMRYLGSNTKDSMVATGLSNPTIVKHIENWNSTGTKALIDHRSGSDSKLETEIIDDIIYVVINKSPIDFAFTTHTWICALLVIYVKQIFGMKVCDETIIRILISHKISYKRAQLKPTKADKQEQEKSIKNARTTKFFRVFI